MKSDSLFILHPIERRAYLILAVVAVVAGYYHLWYRPAPIRVSAAEQAEIDQKIETERRYQDSVLQAARVEPLDLNEASAADLMQRGMTQRLSENIVRYRDASQGFSGLRHVLRVHGMDSAVLEEFNIYVEESKRVRDYPSYVERRAAPPRRDRKISTNTTSGRAPRKKDTLHVNSDDADAISALGLPKWLAERIVKFRAAHGPMKNMQELSRVYGLDTALLQSRTIDFSYIPPPTRPIENIAPLTKKSDPEVGPSNTVKTSPSEDRKFNYSIPGVGPDNKLDINIADSISLIRIRGIGAKSAHIILSDRRAYGGYVHMDQILKNRKLHPQVRARIDSVLTIISSADYIKLDRGSIRDLERHPYVNHVQAQYLIHYASLPPEGRDTAHIPAVFSLSEWRRLQAYLPAGYRRERWDTSPYGRE